MYKDTHVGSVREMCKYAGGGASMWRTGQTHMHTQRERERE